MEVELYQFNIEGADIVLIRTIDDDDEVHLLMSPLQLEYAHYTAATKHFSTLYHKSAKYPDIKTKESEVFGDEIRFDLNTKIFLLGKRTRKDMILWRARALCDALDEVVDRAGRKKFKSYADLNDQQIDRLSNIIKRCVNDFDDAVDSDLVELIDEDYINEVVSDTKKPKVTLKGSVYDKKSNWKWFPSSGETSNKRKATTELQSFDKTEEPKLISTRGGGKKLMSREEYIRDAAANDDLVDVRTRELIRLEEQIKKAKQEKHDLDELLKMTQTEIDEGQHKLETVQKKVESTKWELTTILKKRKEAVSSVVDEIEKVFETNDFIEFSIEIDSDDNIQSEHDLFKSEAPFNAYTSDKAHMGDEILGDKMSVWEEVGAEPVFSMDDIEELEDPAQSKHDLFITEASVKMSVCEKVGTEPVSPMETDLFGDDNWF